MDKCAMPAIAGPPRPICFVRADYAESPYRPRRKWRIVQTQLRDTPGITALAYEIRWERPFGVYERFSGVHTPEETAQVIEAVTSDAGFDDLRYVIVDLLGTTGHRFDVTSRAALEVPYAMLIGASYSNPHLQLAFVVTDPQMVQLIELKFARGILPHSGRIFASEQQARDWLGSLSGSFRRPVSES